LALRGPDGSMMTATDGLYQERSNVFRAFGHGLILTICSVVMCVWLHLHWEASLVCCTISICTMMKMKSTYQRIVKKFDFDESLTVDLNDIFSTGPKVTKKSFSQFGMMNGNDSQNIQRKNSDRSEEDVETDRLIRSRQSSNSMNNSGSPSKRPTSRSATPPNQFEMV